MESRRNEIPPARGVGPPMQQKNGVTLGRAAVLKGYLQAFRSHGFHGQTSEAKQLKPDPLNRCIPHPQSME